MPLPSLHASLKPTLYTPRLTLTLFHANNTTHPEEYTCLLSSMNSATAHERMGDFGIDTPDKFDAMNRGSRLRSSATGLEPDCDVYYLVRLSTPPESTVLGALNASGSNYLTSSTPTSVTKTELKLQGPLIGGVSLMQHSSTLPPDLGWAFLEKYHGQGYATEAAGELLRYTKDELGLTELIVWPGATNVQSQRVASKIGFVKGYEGTDEKGESVWVFVLSGMEVKEEDVRLSIMGDDGEGK